MDSARKRLVEDYLAGDLTGSRAKEVMKLCARDEAFRRELAHEAEFSQLLRMTVQRTNAASERSDFAAHCIESAADLAVRGIELPLDGGLSGVDASRERSPRRLILWAPMALAASLVIGLGITALFRAPPADVPAGALGQIVSVSPGVRVERSGRTLPMGVGAGVLAGDVVVTGPRQEAVLKYADAATQLALGEETRFAIQGARLSRLESGQVTAEVGRQAPGQPFVLELPHARATVLGTRLALGSTAQASRLDVFDGRVQFQHQKGASAWVNAGQYSVAEAESTTMAVFPASVDYEAVSRLRREYRDGPAIFTDDFESGLKGWTPWISDDPERGKGNPSRSFPALKSGSQVSSINVGISDADLSGRRSKMLRLLSDGNDGLTYGVWYEFSKIMRSYSVEFKVSRIAGLRAPGEKWGFRGLMAGVKTPTNRMGEDQMPQSPAYGVLPQQLAPARLEYIAGLDENRNVVLDTKVFIDGRLDSWFISRGRPSEFGPEMILGVANGGLLVDDVVIRPLVPSRFGAATLALYLFDEGRNDRVYDVSGIGEPIHLTIGKTDEVQWLGRGLKIGRGAAIESAAAKKMAAAWRRNHSIAIEWWERPHVAGREVRKASGFMDIKSTDYMFTCSQLMMAATTEPAIPLQHFVMTLTAPQKKGEDVVAAFHQNGLFIGSGKADRRTVDGAMGNAGSRICIPGGAWKGKAGTDEPWEGECSMLVIHERALTPGEIFRNFQAGLPETQKQAMGLTP